VPLFSRRPSPPSHLPLPPPGLDGAGWPDEGAAGRGSFESSTYYELAVRHAYDLEAHAVGDRLVDDLLPLVSTGVSEQDEPYLHKVFLTAARIGAGIGIVERSLGPANPQLVDRHIAGALWQGRRKLPAMQPDWGRTAGFFLLAGFHVVRGGREVVDRLADELGPGERS
jgi:hypothetical protein